MKYVFCCFESIHDSYMSENVEHPNGFAQKNFWKNNMLAKLKTVEKILLCVMCSSNPWPHIVMHFGDSPVLKIL